jgi:hypothetical protein
VGRVRELVDNVSISISRSVAALDILIPRCRPLKRGLVSSSVVYRMNMSHQVMDPPSLTSLDAFLFEGQDLATRTRFCLVHFGVCEDVRRVSTHTTSK